MEKCTAKMHGAKIDGTNGTQRALLGHRTGERPAMGPHGQTYAHTFNMYQRGKATGPSGWCRLDKDTPTTPAGAPAAAALRMQRPDAACEGTSG